MADVSGADSAGLAPLMQALGRHRGLIFPVACIALLGVLLVPLPAMLLDLLLVVNLTVSVLLLVTAIYVRSPLEFTVLPSLLLATTLFRLTLNVATTRLILTAGADGGSAEQSLGDAGQVVQAFAQVVTSGSLAVGFIIFLIIFVIQFVVITKGATRIGEVAARFTLDAMPGRQMAIVADLNAGVIDDQEARRRREELGQQADFYGAMDGASKFLRGDAVAGLLITFVNVLGGMYIGLVERNWGVGETAALYTRLTIGDGLVSQVPAFITALGCGLIITRSSARSELGEQVVSQLFTQARPLWVAAAFLLCLSVTGMPALPLILLSACCGGLAWMLGRQAAAAAAETESAKVVGDESKAESVEKLLDVEAIELLIGPGLVRLADQARGGDLMERITALRRQIALELGLIVPAIRVRDSQELVASEYALKLRGLTIARGEAYPDQFLAVDDGTARGPLPHAVEQPDPASGRRAYWVTEPQVAEARKLRYTVLEAPAALAAHVTEVIRQHAAELLSRQEVRNLLDHLKTTAPALVEEVVGAQVKPGELQRVLQNLLRERVPIRDLETILETMGEASARTRDIEALTAACREALARTICRLHVDETDTLRCVRLSPALEEIVYERSRNEETIDGSISGHVFPPVADRIADRVRSLTGPGRPAVVLCAPRIRPAIRRMLEGSLPPVAVLGYNEVVPEVRLEESSVIGPEP